MANRYPYTIKRITVEEAQVYAIDSQHALEIMDETELPFVVQDQYHEVERDDDDD